MYEVLISHEAEKYYKKQDKDTKRRLNKCIDALSREPLFGQHIGLGLDKQLRQIWRTNSVLCSAVVEGGNVPNAIVRTCISSYLKPQLALVPNAMVAALAGRRRIVLLVTELRHIRHFILHHVFQMKKNLIHGKA